LHTKPKFLQGIFAFEGKGLEQAFLVDAALSYVVPGGVHTQPVYFRGGNSSDELVCAILTRDGRPMRYFPIGARGDVHVSLRVVEDLEPGTTVELHLAAPVGTAGTLVVDLGLVEV
jgi:assimilatory nitrate reductase catalytic subunit